MHLKALCDLLDLTRSNSDSGDCKARDEGLWETSFFSLHKSSDSYYDRIFVCNLDLPDFYEGDSRFLSLYYR